MAKPKGTDDQATAPTSFPATAPPQSLDQSFTLPTIMTMQSQLGGIVKQLEHIEKKMDDVSADVKVHGRWIFAANAVLAVMIAVVAFLAPRVWDLLVARAPATPPAVQQPALMQPVAPLKR
jgi:hypothetical protein